MIYNDNIELYIQNSLKFKTIETPKIKMGKQGKSKARRGFEGIVVRKGKLKTNMLDGTDLKTENHEEEEK